MGTTGYNNRGLYNKYDKHHHERDKLDYYATPTAEAENILRILDIDFSNQTILKPCIGGGHMAKGIDNYIKEKGCLDVTKIGTDIKDRGFLNTDWQLEYGLDFFDDNYPNNKADWVIMNPPYATIEPFVIRTLEIVERGIIMLGRLQFLEGSGRYENILKDNPLTDVYVYVDRISCWKDGIQPDSNGSQAYAWFIWNKEKNMKNTELHWIRRAE